MKIKSRPNFWIPITIGVYLTVATAFYLIDSYKPGRQQSVDIIDNLKPFDNMLPDNVTLQEGTSHYSFSKNAIAYNWSGGAQMVFIGTTGGLSCDTCNCDTCISKWITMGNDTNATHKKYYIKLPFWKINNTTSAYWYVDSVKFHQEKNQGYIRKISMEPQTKNDKFHKGHLVDIPVKFMYDEKNQNLLIPISKPVKKGLEIFLVVGTIALFTYFGYLVTCFLSFIIDLSKGLAFTDKNIARLKLIAITLILYPFVLFLLNLLMKIVFYSYFTADVIMNKSVWQNSLEPIGIGLVFFLLYRAFAQGKSLKDEHDLTV